MWGGKEYLLKTQRIKADPPSLSPIECAWANLFHLLICTSACLQPPCRTSALLHSRRNGCLWPVDSRSLAPTLRRKWGTVSSFQRLMSNVRLMVILGYMCKSFSVCHCFGPSCLHVVVYEKRFVYKFHGTSWLFAGFVALF